MKLFSIFLKQKTMTNKAFCLENPKLKITGGIPLKGQIKISGAKNATTKLLVASMLSDKKSIFYNVPEITEVDITLSLCKEIGMEAVWDKKNKTIEAHTPFIKTTTISQQFSGANRIPILLLGAFIGRTDQEIRVPVVGGDNLGPRPLDFHINALQKLGATVRFEQNGEEKSYVAIAKNGLKGALINLPYPSVGATENSILAAVRAKGTTVITNAAIEPEIVDLILFLQKSGVHITLDVNRTIYIQQTLKFHEVEHHILTDRNEVVSYALAAIATKGSVFIEGADHSNMIFFLNKLREIGADFKVKKDGIEFSYVGKLKGGIHLETDVHPGFMTDWQQPFGVLLTQCSGASIIHETVYEKRFGYTQILKEMGADIELFTQCLGEKCCRFAKLNHIHSVVIKGITSLTPKEITIPDLRAGFAYIMAALLANGTSEISEVHFLDRGYENLAEKLTSLGADVKKIGSGDKLKPFLKKTQKQEV
jgi:UDP-N-acetylglucosamine 1-carboxyvinyltransferase